MNQQRLQSYLALIQQLLACPSGEEWILLRRNESLVTPELVGVMEQVADHLGERGHPEEAKFLHNLAGQIHHLFVAQTVRQRDEDGEERAYLEFIQTLLNCPPGKEGELLAKNRELIGPGLTRAMRRAAEQMVARGDEEAANYLQSYAKEIDRLWLETHNFQSVPSPRPAAKPFVPPSPSEEGDFWAEPSSPSVSPEPSWSKSVSPPAEAAISARIEHYLSLIAQALTEICKTPNHVRATPADPLWHLEALERAARGNWVLTGAEIQQLIGIEPICPKDSDSFERGGWHFTKAGKVGSQTGWRVKKTD